MSPWTQNLLSGPLKHHFNTDCLFRAPTSNLPPVDSLILLLSQAISFNCPFLPLAVSLPCGREETSLLGLGACSCPGSDAQGGSADHSENLLQLLSPQLPHPPVLSWRKMRVCLGAEPLLACPKLSSTCLFSDSWPLLCPYPPFVPEDSLPLFATLLPALRWACLDPIRGLFLASSWAQQVRCLGRRPGEVRTFIPMVPSLWISSGSLVAGQSSSHGAPFLRPCSQSSALPPLTLAIDWIIGLHSLPLRMPVLFAWI